MAGLNEKLLFRPHQRLPVNRNSERDINILLLGETGVGKTTFINAVANYLVHDSLDAALEGDMQILIPTTFSVTDAATYNSTKITIGTHDKNELCEDNGQSQTQGCKSYLFGISDRSLRLIDTPGVADCRGVQQDNENFAHILSFISRYKHLNGICILLKPNDHRLNISFKYIIKESLKHLHINAKDNIIFIFTNARANFFVPGATANQLRILLNEIKTNRQIDVPFDKENTFVFDNETFRYLAIRKNGHHFFDEQKSSIVECWNKSVKELFRLLTRIVKCRSHTVHDMKLLNEAQQLIHKLPRPIAEVATLIQENIQLAEQHENKVLENDTNITPNELPERIAEIVSLRYPRTICTSNKCSEVKEMNGVKKVDYKVICHERCHLKGVGQEVIKNRILKHCRAMDKTSGQCQKCGCGWDSHMHVTYEFHKRMTYRKIDENPLRILSQIRDQITALKKEQEIIQHICNKLRIFIRINSLNPTNEDVIEYINFFIEQERRTSNSENNNAGIIRGLENLVKNYQEEFKLMNEKIDENNDSSDVPTIEDVFVCKCQLFELPITGKYFELQIESLNIDQLNQMDQREVYVDLPQSAQFSANMEELKKVIN